MAWAAAVRAAEDGRSRSLWGVSGCMPPVWPPPQGPSSTVGGIGASAQSMSRLLDGAQQLVPAAVRAGQGDQAVDPELGEGLHPLPGQRAAGGDGDLELADPGGALDPVAGLGDARQALL